MQIVGWTLCVLFLSRFIQAEKVDAVEQDTNDVKFPEPINAAEFDDKVPQHLHLVEFYSPYCHHCKTLAPIWKKAWEDFHVEGSQLNISLVQVNCVESADLCAREKIAAYPAIKLYGPGGFIKDYPEIKRSADHFINFARQEALNADNLQTSLMKSQSKELEGTALLRLISGKAEVPHLVSFWPSKELKSVDEDSVEFENCDQCHGFQKTWTALSSKLSSEDFVAAHVNCEVERTICEELEFGDLAEIKNHRVDRVPRVILVVPQKKTSALFHYTKEDYTIKAIEDFALRTSANAQVQEISGKALQKLITTPIEIKKGLSQSEGSIHIVFNYDSESVVPQDFDILERLVEPISNIPNAYLHKSADDLKSLSHSLFLEMYKKINHIIGDRDLIPNKEYFTMKSDTQLPTFYIFKQESLISHVLSGYSTTETHNQELILNWVDQNRAPLLSQLMPENYKEVLNYQPKIYDFMAIQIIDTSSNEQARKSAKYMENLKVSALEYESDRINFLFNSVKEGRTTKDEAVETSKTKQAPSSDILTKMRDEIARNDDHRVQFTYLDLSLHESVLKDAGLKASKRVFKNGDALVLNKGTRSFFVEKSLNGERLTTEKPYDLKNVLYVLAFGTGDENNTIIKESFKNSGHLLTHAFGRFQESFGLFGYLLLGAVLVLLAKLPQVCRKQYVRRKYRNRRDVTGILGKQKGKD
ncbi:LAFA_0D08790g1_1 [Lachancea sp. 'fantastica']|nr:LAFA_0D08790g1_1 [Lachancea sp. 'fantastica']